jgi:hypothetical protein
LSEETPQQKPENPLETLDKALDSYEESIGLKKFTETDVTVYMNLNSEDLRKMSPEECVEGAYLLNQEALYVQHEINKHRAQMDWAIARINREVTKDIPQYGDRFTPFDYKRVLAIKNSASASKLQQIVDKAERIIARLSYIPNHLTKLASVLLDYRHNKMAVNSKTSQNREY